MIIEKTELFNKSQLIFGHNPNPDLILTKNMKYGTQKSEKYD